MVERMNIGDGCTRLEFGWAAGCVQVAAWRVSTRYGGFMRLSFFVYFLHACLRAGRTPIFLTRENYLF